MNPITHALISWGISNIPRNTTRRQRALVTLGGIIPDLDGLGAIWDKTFGTLGDIPSHYYHDYHRVLGHTAAFAAVVLLVPLLFSKPGKRLVTTALFALTFHLHLVCDMLGSRGPPTDFNPGGDVWGIPYFHLPLFKDAPALGDPVWWKWAGQWELNAWPNLAITLLLLVFCGVMAVRAKRTILEVLSLKLDGVVVGAFQQRFGNAAHEADAQSTGQATGDASEPE